MSTSTRRWGFSWWSRAKRIFCTIVSVAAPTRPTCRCIHLSDPVVQLSPKGHQPHRNARGRGCERTADGS